MGADVCGASVFGANIFGANIFDRPDASGRFAGKPRAGGTGELFNPVPHFPELSMKKTLSLAIAALCLTATAQAHQVWIEQPGGKSAIARFGEFAENLRRPRLATWMASARCRRAWSRPRANRR
ncbi:hypothetical protein WJ973_17860 [Achromobacter xylosoxidans]